MGRRTRGEGLRAMRALLDHAPLADALPAPLLLADPLGHPVHPNPAFLLAFGPPPSPWTALTSGPDRVTAEAAWLAAGAARGPREARIACATGQVLARVTPVESGRRLLGWAVALAPIPDALPLVASTVASPPAPLAAEAPPRAQATEATNRAAEGRLALAEAGRREAEDRRAEAEARADRLADRLRSLEAEPPAPPADDPGPGPLSRDRPVPSAETFPEPTRADAPDTLIALSPRPAPDADLSAEVPPSSDPRPGLSDTMEFTASPLPNDRPAAPLESADPQRDSAGSTEVELDLLAQRLSAPALRQALALWRDGAEDWLHLVGDAEVDRVAVGELLTGGELGPIRIFWATAGSPLLAAMPPTASDPNWARCAGEGRPVAQRAEVSLGPRRFGVERLFLPIGGETRFVLLMEAATSVPASPFPLDA